MIKRVTRQRPEYTQWCARFRASPLGIQALEKLRELDQGDLEAYKQLEAQVLAECFHAELFNLNRLADDFEKLHDDAREFKESIDDLLSAVGRIKRATKARPFFIAKYLRPVSHYMQMQMKAGESLPDRIARTFAEILEGFESNLLAAKMDQAVSSGRIAGCLEYPTDIRNQRSANHAENGLIFSLARIFRHWTAPELRQGGALATMPVTGRPCNAIVASFVHAALHASHDAPQYGAEAIGDKLKKLLKNHHGVSYVGWGG